MVSLAVSWGQRNNLPKISVGDISLPKISGFNSEHKTVNSVGCGAWSAGFVPHQPCHSLSVTSLSSLASWFIIYKMGDGSNRSLRAAWGLQRDNPVKQLAERLANIQQPTRWEV